MNNLIIKQGNIPENVDSETLNLLNQITSDPLYNYNEDNLSGVLTSNRARRLTVQTLKEKFPNLDILVNELNLYIDFVDSDAESTMAAVIGDGVGVTEYEAATTTSFNFGSYNTKTLINTFDEMPKFTYMMANGGLRFDGCSNLTSVDFSKLETASIVMFRDCVNLKIDLNAPMLRLFQTDKSFYHSGITSISNLGEVTKITSQCFALTWWCSGKVVLPSTCTTLDDAAFRECKTSLSIDLLYITTLNGGGHFLDCNSMPYVENYNLTYIPNSCFSKCNLQTFDFSNISTIGNFSFGEGRNDQLLNMTISIPNLTSIGSGAFNSCKFKNVTNLGSIALLPGNTGNDARYWGVFCGCSKLETLIIPSTVLSIGGYLFNGCTSLRWIKCLATLPPTLSTAYKGISSPNNILGWGCRIYVPDASLSDYTSAQYWSDFAVVDGVQMIRPMSLFATDFPND